MHGQCQSHPKEVWSNDWYFTWFSCRDGATQRKFERGTSTVWGGAVATMQFIIYFWMHMWSAQLCTTWNAQLENKYNNTMGVMNLCLSLWQTTRSQGSTRNYAYKPRNVNKMTCTKTLDNHLPIQEKPSLRLVIWSHSQVTHVTWLLINHLMSGAS